MNRRVSPALGLLRCVVAIVTVWCTGCAGFEPLLDGLVASTTGMACESSSAMSAADDAGVSVTASQNQTASVQASPASDARSAFSCGCSSCHAVTLAQWSAAALRLPELGPVASQELPMPSVGRVPLLPPPNRSL